LEQTKLSKIFDYGREMDGEILGVFLQSGPARKHDVSRFTRAIVANKDSQPLLLFRNKFLNHSILFSA
jgi:hypothetical protein